MRKAFTLAEVLITLGIIGVVAALTMPALIAKYQKQVTITKLKKVYSILNQAMKLSEVDNGDYDTWDTTLSASDYVDKYWLPYFKVMKVCDTYKACGYSKSAPFIAPNGTADVTSVVIVTNRKTFVTTDGTLYSIWTIDGILGPSDDIVVDLNYSKPPNQWGRDVFRFTRVAGKGVLTKSYDTPDLS